MSEINKKRGNESEQSVADFLFSKSYWVLKIRQNEHGQAADILAVRHNRAFLIDVKRIKDDYFELSRVEANQNTSMMVWETHADNGVGWFALDYDNGETIMLTSEDVNNLIDSGITRVHWETARDIGVTIERWVDLFEIGFK